jgi:hypothetical protein
MTRCGTRLALAGAALLLAAPAGAATLKVGPGEPLTVPSQAARQATDGDTIVIAAGEYYDCAVWPQNRITITGPEDPATPAILTDAACQGKALFVVMGQGVTIRHLTFTRVRVPDGNGAGIRAEGPDLTIADSRFVNNQSGILAADAPGGSFTVLDSIFERNGAAMGEHCAATLQLGLLARLRIERTRFASARTCDMVRAAAQRTDVLDSRFEDGGQKDGGQKHAPAGAAQRMLALGAGALLVRDTVFAFGPQHAAPTIAIERRDLWGSAGDALVQRATLENASGRPATLVHNLTAGAVRLDNNKLSAGDSELDESGYWTARARGTVRGAINTVRSTAGSVKRTVRSLLPF